MFVRRILSASILCTLLAGFTGPASFLFAAESEQTALPHTDIVQTPEGLFAQHSGAPSNIIPGEVIVKFADDTTAEDVASKKKSHDGKLTAKSDKLAKAFAKGKVKDASRVFKTKEHGMGRVMRLQAEDGNAQQLIDELNALPEVEYAEPNMRVEIFMVPNDPYYSSTGAWGQAFRDMWGLEKLGTETAWNQTQGNGVVVAVIDTGIDAAHTDLAANMWTNPGESGALSANGVDDDGNGYIDDWRGWDFASNDNNPMDDHGHGTHVAGTIAAVGNNNTGIIGVAPQARVMAVKALDINGSGETSWLAAAIEYAANRGASVINASWGGSSTTPIQVMADAVAYAHDVKGAVFVAAAGNSNQDVGTEDNGFFPASYRDAITVAATTSTDAKASFSNFGPKIDVAAPGGGDTQPTSAYDPSRSILSLKSSLADPNMTANGQLVLNTNYLRQAGTSMAAPHVAGLAALIRSLHPEYTPEQVRQVIRRSATDILAAGFDTQSGYGRINAANALAETNPLSVQLTAPAFKTLTGPSTVDIRGTATGPGFTQWNLEYGAGNAPAAWTTITSSTTPSSEALLTSWNITAVPDGLYTIRLSATGSGGTVFQDRTTFTIKQVLISNPPQGVVTPFFPRGTVTPFRGGAQITVSGTANPAQFSSFSLSILKSDGTPLAAPSITLTGNGQQPVTNGVLGIWDTTGVPADQYTIRLSVTSGAGTVSTSNTNVLVDPTLHTGWPRSVLPIVPVMFQPVTQDHLIAADVTGDGKMEMFISYGAYVYAYQEDGTPLPGWPKSVVADPISNPNATSYYGPVIGDIDGDGTPEIVAGANPYMFAWRADGTNLPGWPKFQPGAGSTSYALADLDTNPGKEIIFSPRGTGMSSMLYAMNAAGTILPGFPRTFTDSSYLSPASSADLNNDGRMELVVLDQYLPGNLYVLSNSGQTLPGWPQPINNSSSVSMTNPVLADLDEDGYLDILVSGNTGTVSAFRRDGTPLPGWPKTPRTNIQLNTPGIGDIDGDGHLDVTVGLFPFILSNMYRNEMYAWSRTGSLLPGWPVQRQNLTSIYFGFGAPAVGDVNADGKADVLSTHDVMHFSLQAISGNATTISGFPKPTIDLGSSANSTPVIADIDGNGFLEAALLDKSGFLYVWDLPSPASSPVPWPMFQHDASHTGRLTGPDVIAPTVQMTNPSENSMHSGSILTVRASATDNVGVTRVEFFKDGSGTPFASDLLAPYTASIDGAQETEGNHTLQAKAYDAAGKVGTSSLVSFSIDRQAPAISLTSPIQNATLSGSIMVRANASDNTAIRKVEFYRDGAVAPFVTILAGPYETALNTTTLTDGIHTFQAKAFDTAGNKTLSPLVSVTVENFENVPPTVTITAPLNNAPVKGTITVTASASDNIGVTRVEFYKDSDTTPFVTDTSNPYQATLDTTTLSTGNHTLRAKAFDAADNSTTSAAITIKVDNILPTVSVTSPANGASVSRNTTIAIQATASDNVGVTSVEFYVSGALKCTDTTAPYSCNWLVPSPKNVTYTLVAIARDAAANSKTSSTITVQSR